MTKHEYFLLIFWCKNSKLLFKNQMQHFGFRLCDLNAEVFLQIFFYEEHHSGFQPFHQLTFYFVFLFCFVFCFLFFVSLIYKKYITISPRYEISRGIEKIASGNDVEFPEVIKKKSCGYFGRLLLGLKISKLCNTILWSF